MHSLYGLQQIGLEFELKGGTSLSKGFGVIERFSEDIDIRIEPPESLSVNTNPKSTKKTQVQGRKAYYDWLADNINIDGLAKIDRDTKFDDERYYRSGGIRLRYPMQTGVLDGIKDGVLLEVGFDDVTPNISKTITSWAYEYARDKVEVIDNRAMDVACYHPGYTFVEKLQTISTKFRQQQAGGSFPVNFMRHYYDVFCLLGVDDVNAFIGTADYLEHKARRFPKADNLKLDENEAFLLNDGSIYKQYENAYDQSTSLYYREQPKFETIIKRIRHAVQNTKGM